ncbi:MAG: putative transposase, partial [Paracoccaceae bacterium]
DETYIKVKGKWTYYSRAVDKFGKTLDFMLSGHRDEAAATAFFPRAIGNNGVPDRVVIDKSGANLAGLQNMNCVLILNGWFWLIEVLQVKPFNAVSATLEGIEVAHMIRKRQFETSGQSAFKQFAALAG